MKSLKIEEVKGREILDSRGNPTVEVEVAVGEGILGLEGHMGRAQVPSGASTGKFEALEKRDQEVRYLGQGVRKAVEAVNTVLADAVVGENALEQERIDHILCQADGTETKENLGANAILGVSLAVARAAANAIHLPLYQYLGGCHTSRMPVQRSATTWIGWASASTLRRTSTPRAMCARLLPGAPRSAPWSSLPTRS